MFIYMTWEPANITYLWRTRFDPHLIQPSHERKYCYDSTKISAIWLIWRLKWPRRPQKTRHSCQFLNNLGRKFKIMVEIECEIASKSDMVAEKLYIFQDEYLANFLSFEKFYHKKSKIPTKMNFPKMSFLHELAKIEIFMVMFHSIFWLPIPPPGRTHGIARVMACGCHPRDCTRPPRDCTRRCPGGRGVGKKIEGHITMKISILSNSFKNDIFEKSIFVGIFHVLP